MEKIRVDNYKSYSIAVDFLRNANGGEIVMMSGDYYVPKGDSLPVCSNFTISAEPYVYVLKDEPAPIIDAANVFNVNINNIKFVYKTKTSLQNHVIIFSGSFNITLNRVSIQCNEHGVVRTKDKTIPRAIIFIESDTCSVYNSSILFGCRYIHPGTGEVTYKSGIGISLNSSNYCRLCNNNIELCTSGIYIKDGNNNIIQNNFISDIKQHIDDGVKRGGIGINADYGSNNDISGNIINECDSHGIYLSGSNNTKIYNNNIEKCEKNGIQLNKGCEVNDPYVRYNIIYANHVSFNKHFGIGLFRYAYDNIVTGNICLNNTRGAIHESSGDKYFPEEEWSKGNIIANNVSV